MGLVDSVCRNVDPECLVSRMRKAGCTLSLKDAPKKRLIVDFDRPKAPIGGSGPKCDYLFVAEDAQGNACWIAPLELKKGALRASDALRQLRAGAEVADRLVPQGLRPSFRPAAVCGNIQKWERAALKSKQNRIAFRGRLKAVLLAKCGGGITNILGS